MVKIIHKLINEFTEGVDTYTHNNSTWLIFTESKQWVIELTDTKTLWYNYNFFKSIFAYASLDCVQNQHLITKWVEDNITNKVNHTEDMVTNIFVDDTLENGVKKTKMAYMKTDWSIDDTLQNGLKTRNYWDNNRSLSVNKVIDNGIKETNYDTDNYTDDVKEVIKEGVKTSHPRQYVGEEMIDRVIDKGVIETHREICEYKHTVEHIIQTGVKETHDDVYHHKGRIDGVIKNGVKETKHANKYDSIGPVIKEGKINDIIDNGVKVSGTFVGGNRQKENIESVIGYGTKNPTD